MGIQLIGNTGVIAEVEAATRALRVTGRPIDYGSLGVYSATAITGTVAAGIAANSEVLQFRWTDATRVAVILAVDMWAGNAGTAFTAGVFRFEAVIARAWTAAGTGGATLVLTGNNNKLRTSMGTSLVGEIRVATTAALGAGTKTLDAQGIASLGGGVPATAGQNMVQGRLFDALEGGRQPPVFVQNEGFVVRTTVPATGTWTAGFNVYWAELTSY